MSMYTSIHHVTKVRLSSTDKLEGGTCIRSLSVYDDKGRVVDITLFADSSAEELSVVCYEDEAKAKEVSNA